MGLEFRLKVMDSVKVRVSFRGMVKGLRVGIGLD